MPLKHHTETAYIVFLAFATAFSGFIASILPQYPAGFTAWVVCMTCAVLYPILLTHTFRENRADYEFRLLHWFPACIFTLWIIFEFIGSKAGFLHILQLGFFFLWSLPLVALAIAFLILFSLHVIRRWIPRITILALMLILFTVGSVMAETWNLNPRLQRIVFSEKESMYASVRDVASAGIRSLIAIVRHPTHIEDSPKPHVIAKDSRSSSVSTIDVDGLQMSSSMPPAIAVRKPRGLSSSGPEDVAVLFLTILAMYSMTLHMRARRRISA